MGLIEKLALGSVAALAILGDKRTGKARGASRGASDRSQDESQDDAIEPAELMELTEADAAGADPGDRTEPRPAAKPKKKKPAARKKAGSRSSSKRA